MSDKDQSTPETILPDTAPSTNTGSTTNDSLHNTPPGASTAKTLPVQEADTPINPLMSGQATIIDNTPDESTASVSAESAPMSEPVDSDSKSTGGLEDTDVEELLDGMDFKTDEELAKGSDSSEVDPLDLDSIMDEIDQANKEPEIITPRVVVPLSDRRDTLKRVISESLQYGNNETKLKEAQADPATDVAMMTIANQWYNENQKILKESLKLVADKQTETNRVLSDILANTVPGVQEGLSKTFGRRADRHGEILPSAKGAALITATISGFRRLTLYNSGLSITIRALRINEITSYFNSINISETEYGRTLGGWYFFYADLKVKEMVLRHLLPLALISSSYRHWRDIDKLLKQISINDFDTILWGFSTLMFREGVPIRFACANKDCKSIEELTIDLSRLRLENMDLITPEMRRFLADTKVRDDADLEYYRNELLNFKDAYVFDIHNLAIGETSHWQLNLHVSNCWDYLQWGSQFNNELLDNISSDAPALALEEINRQLIYNFYKMFLPWITSISQLNDDNSPMYTVLNDGAGDKFFKDILDVQQMENTQLGNYIKDFILKTRITHIAYRYDKCPVCGMAPTTGIQGLIPYDMQSNFFLLCLLRMTIVSSTQRR